MIVCLTGHPALPLLKVAVNFNCKQLVDLDNVQGAMLLLRYCHTIRLNHLARGVCPETLEPAVMIHDQQTKSTFTTLLRFDDISDPSWVQATLYL